MRSIGLAALCGFIATIPFANWLVVHYGVVEVAPGLQAPAAVYAVGLALILRDVAHRSLGRWWTVAGIAVGAALSLLISPAFAVASAAAFAVSESADLAVYEPLRRRGWTVAMSVSNVVGACVDSAVFLWLAFGSLAFFSGQVVGKLTMTALALVLLAGSRAVLARHA